MSRNMSNEATGYSDGLGDISTRSSDLRETYDQVDSQDIPSASIYHPTPPHGMGSDVVDGYGGVIVEVRPSTETEPRRNTTHPATWLLQNGPKPEGTDILHVVAVLSNPCRFKKRVRLFKEFLCRMEEYERQGAPIRVYTVELVYNDDSFEVTGAPIAYPPQERQLQLRAEHVLWHKENMINLGIEKLLPKDWNFIAWVDSDITFESCHWANDTLRLLGDSGPYNVVQLFSCVLDLDGTDRAMAIHQGFGYKWIEGHPYQAQRGVNYWHPGYAWAMRRDLYEYLGGLFELDILGSGDYHMAIAFLPDLDRRAYYAGASTNYREVLDVWTDRARGLHPSNADAPVGVRLGYVPTVIRHSFHGSKMNRKYSERNTILQRNNYQPSGHVQRNADGILQPTEACPRDLLAGILQYFRERNEDE